MKPIHVAFVYDKKLRLLAIGHNSYTKTHPKQASLAEEAGEPKRIFLHAEIDAIIKALKTKQKPKYIQVFRNRVYKSIVNDCSMLSKIELCKPCKICLLAIEKAGMEML